MHDVRADRTREAWGEAVRRGAAVTWEQVRVGLLILVSLAVLSVAVFLVGDAGRVFGERYNLVTLVRSASGLVPGAAVQLAGQTVGQVSEIRFISPGDRYSYSLPHESRSSSYCMFWK